MACAPEWGKASHRPPLSPRLCGLQLHLNFPRVHRHFLSFVSCKTPNCIFSDVCWVFSDECPYSDINTLGLGGQVWGAGGAVLLGAARPAPGGFPALSSTFTWNPFLVQRENTDLPRENAKMTSSLSWA